MRVWRICRRRYAGDPLSGRGGLAVSGRWHTRGRRVTYTSGSLALAALELLVHADGAELPDDLVQIEIAIPDDLAQERIEASSLPRTWRRHPAPDALQRFGDDWLRRRKTLVLRAPSAVIPEEFNYLLNPLHPDARRLKVVGTERFVYDPRLAPPKEKPRRGRGGGSARTS